MPRHSATDNVRKICACVKWKTCAHPWYVDYRDGKEVVGGKVRVRGLRCSLDKLIGRHAADFAEAKAEAKRAIVAWNDGRSAADLLPSDDATLAQLLAEYEKEKPLRNRWQVGRILATELPSPDGVRRFGDWRASAIAADTLKAFRHQRPLVAGNRDLALLRAACNWAVLGGLLPRSPFRVGDVPAVKLAHEEPRSRRLQLGEAERLMQAARGLHDLILAALETGCRSGELLSMQWRQIRFSPRAEVFLPAQKTKAKRDRRVPISTVLRPVLEARRLDPAGEPIPPDGYVLGDAIGRRRRSIKTAWRLCCGRAKILDLHFHDLRREAGSRWMDAGVPLATIQRWLGHANIAQTSTYLGASPGGDESDMRLYEERVGRKAHAGELSHPTGSEPSASTCGETGGTQ